MFIYGIIVGVVLTLLVELGIALFFMLSSDNKKDWKQ